MINLLSNVFIIDNSGAKEGIMIKRLIPKLSTKNSPALVGHVISLSVRKTISKKGNISNSGGQIAQKKNKIQRKKVYQALVVRTKKWNNKINKKDYQKNLNNTSINNTNNFFSFPDRRMGEFANNIYKINLTNNNPYTESITKNEKINYKFKNNINLQKLGGHTITWKDNAVVLIKLVKSEFQPIGTRIKGPICKSLKMQKGCLKIVSISNIN